MQVTTTTPLFAATLKPDRSLRTAGGWVALACVGMVGGPLLIAAPEILVPSLAAYVAAGAGLFGFGMRQARRGKLVQQVTVWPEQVEIVTSGPGTEPTMRRYEPNSVRLRLVRDAEERTTAVFLRHGEDELELGTFLSASDKSSFGRALGTALRQARKST
jgi:uncharacterized membrane protein